jgi:hypothetical protein
LKTTRREAGGSPSLQFDRAGIPPRGLQHEP